MAELFTPYEDMSEAEITKSLSTRISREVLHMGTKFHTATDKDRLRLNAALTILNTAASMILVNHAEGQRLLNLARKIGA